MDNHLTPARIALLYAAFASLWIFASDELLALALPDPTLILRISMFKGFAFVFITTWLLYLLMQTSATRMVSAGSSGIAKAGIFKIRNLIAIFLGLALIVPLFGYGILKIYSPRIQQAAFDDLTVIAELKEGQTELWLKERRDDANELAENIDFIDRFDQWLQRGDTQARTFLLARLDTIARIRGYEPVLLRTDGHRAMTSDATPGPISDQVWRELLATALSSGKVQHSDLYRDSSGKIRLDYLVPLRRPGQQRAVGALVLRAPVEKFLFPLVQSWPTASPSAETVLTRRDGDQVLFLNELRHRKGSALSLRLPLDHSGLPAAISILGDKPLVMEGIDYRGVRVLAATRPIHGTGWHLVAKVDRDEVMALFNEILFWISLVAIVTVMVAASAVLMLWRQRQRIHQMDLVARTAEKDQQLRLFYELPFIGMAISSPSNKAWLYANDCLCDMLGYSRDELLKTTWADITHPDDLASNVAQFERMMTGETDGYTIEKRFIRKDGSPLSVNLDIKCTRGADGRVNHILAMIEDITGRKRTEDALRQAATVFESTHDGVMITDVEGCIQAVNRSFVQITGYNESEVLGLTPNILHSGRQKKDFYQRMWANIKASGYWQGEIWNRRKNGETYPEWLTISAVHNAQGKITHYVGVFSDLSQLKQSETQLEHLAHYDPLTDLPNRLLVQSHLAHALSQAQRHQRLVGVLYIDLDRFKNVNESLGYPVGDELLIKLTERLTMHMRSEDMLARLGGDEFLLVLDHMDSPEDAAAEARSLLELLTQPFVLSGEQEIYIGASVGISVFPNDGSNADQLIQYADAAMHQAKQQGRNSYLFYTESLTRASGEHLELETRLRHAIAHQPVARLLPAAGGYCYRPYHRSRGPGALAGSRTRADFARQFHPAWRKKRD